jgi:hypothetical protein
VHSSTRRSQHRLELLSKNHCVSGEATGLSKIYSLTSFTVVSRAYAQPIVLRHIAQLVQNLHVVKQTLRVESASSAVFKPVKD